MSMNEARLMEESGMVVQEDAISSNELRPGGTLCFVFVCLFMVAIYARPEDVFPVVGKIHATLLVGMCAGVFFLWSLFLGEISLTWPRELRLVLLLTAWFAAGVPFAYWRGGSFLVLTEIWLKTVLIFFLLTQTLVTHKRIRGILWAIILSELAVAAYSLAAPSQGSGVGERMVGVNRGFLYWNFLGIALGMIIPYIAALFIAKASLLRSVLLAATTVLMSWMQVLTASRSGTLVVAFSVMLTCLLVSRGSSRGKIVRMGILFALLVAIWSAPAVFWERVSTITNSDAASANTVEASADLSTQERSTLLMRSVNYTIEHPLFGLGLGMFDVANGNDLNRPDAWMGTHNTYTQLSSEAGLPALLLYLALLYTVLRNMKRVMALTNNDPQSIEVNLMARATIVSLLSFILGALFAHKAYDYYVFTAPIAVAVGVQRITASHQKASLSIGRNLTSPPQHLSPGWTL